MPFKSEAQRGWMYANHPEMAKRWEKHTPKGKKLPYKKHEDGESKEAGVLSMYGTDGLAAQHERAQAFKVGFLRKVAELGMTPSEFMGMVKAAMEPMTALMGLGAGGLGTAWGLGQEAAKYGLYGAALAPVGLGMVSGGLEAKLTSPSVEDIESLRRAELAAKYDRMAKEIRARMARKAAV